MTSFPVLVTQCLQQDFVGPLGRHEPLPNALHVGAEEAARLLGADPAHGPLAQLMAWARAQPHDALEILHVRDWHDPEDPAQGDHLRTFGRHCVQGTRGAELVLGLDAAVVPLPNEGFVEASGLNDFQGTRLEAELGRIRAAARGRPLRVGVIGVWTEAKVSFLLYELKTRYPDLELGTCSALTASASRLQHFNALEQLSRILGVRVFDAVGEFAGWLAGKEESPVHLAVPPSGPGPRMQLAGEAPPLGDAERVVLGHLYRECRQLELHPLGGGFSGARVFRVASVDQLGHAQAPSVAKLGPTRLIGKERTAFEKVQGVLGNSAPSVQGFVDAGAAAGIRYSYASMRQGRIRPLKALFEQGAPTAEIVRVVRHVFDEVFAPFFAASRYERLPLFEHYGFARTEQSLEGPRLLPQLQFNGHVRGNVTALVGAEAAGEVLRHADGSETWNPCRFYEAFLPTARIPWSDSHYVCTVHGDLNGANVLVDDVGNVWVIDFFHTGPGHAWRDLVKLENDLLYLFTPLGNEAELREALRITHALREVEDLRAPLPESLPGLEAPALCRAWTVLRTLRLLGAERTREDRNPWQLDVALLRYAVHTLSFDEASPLQKRWALAAAGGWAEDIAVGTPQAPVLRPGWVDLSGLGLPGSAGLAVVPCPGRRDWGHTLEEDLQTLRADGAQALVGLISGPELAWAGAAELPARCAEAGISYALHHVPDQGVPELSQARAWVAEAAARVRRGEKLVFHCLGGLGRSGMMAACTLAALGLSPGEAIRRVRAERGPRALETEAQQRLVEAFAP